MIWAKISHPITSKLQPIAMCGFLVHGFPIAMIRIERWYRTDNQCVAPKTGISLNRACVCVCVYFVGKWTGRAKYLLKCAGGQNKRCGDRSYFTIGEYFIHWDEDILTWCFACLFFFSHLHFILFFAWLSCQQCVYEYESDSCV